jgi:hypothetical protein
MRTVILSLSAAASALVLPSPAAAQYYPAPPPPPYGQAYAYHGNNWGQVRSLQARLNRLQYRIARLDSRDRISEREARRLRQEARDIERRLRAAAYNGLHPREAASIHYRIERLEFRIFRDRHDGRNRYQRWSGSDWVDRDRDGRDDRWERSVDRHDDEDDDDDEDRRRGRGRGGDDD